MGDLNAERPHQEHRPPRAGRKADKKALKIKTKRGISTEKTNTRAFNVSGAAKALKQIKRNFDRSHRKEYVPQVNRTGEYPPPIMVVVMGPAGSGKSTLIKSLVKKYTRQNLAEVKGPITIITGKERRMTLFECPNDLNAMTDLAKVADLVLLMIDASFGFEMETFEFLNILQLHGFPKVLGVMTHLDKFKHQKALRNAKKRLKNRFWTEIYQGAKLFYLSGLSNGKYPKTEVHNLCLFMSRIKFRPLIWRNTHPYVVVDRYEDLTHPDIVQKNPNADRKLSMYGYVRGTHLKPDMKVHILGVGDFHMDSVTVLADPCPYPSKQKGQSLSDKEILLYAPMSDVGTAMYDNDAVYISLGNLQYSKGEKEKKDEDGVGGSDEDDSDEEKEVPEGVSMIRDLQKISEGMDDRMGDAPMQLFKSSKPVLASAQKQYEDDQEEEEEEEDEEDEEEEEEEEEGSDEEGGLGVGTEGRVRRRWDKPDGTEDDDEDDDEEEEEEDEEEEDEGARWKGDLVSRAAESFVERQIDNANLIDLVYGEGQANILDKNDKRGHSAAGRNRGPSGFEGEDEDLEDEEQDDDFFKPKGSKAKGADGRGSAVDDENESDTSRLLLQYNDEETDEEDDSEDEDGDASMGGGHGARTNGGLRDWADEDVCRSIRHRFVTGGAAAWGEQGAKAQADEDGVLDGAGDDSDEGYGSFEDLETGEVFDGKSKSEGDMGEDEEDGFEDELMDGEEETDEQVRTRMAQEKANAAQRAKDEQGSDEEEEPESDEEFLEEAKKRFEQQGALNEAEFGEEGEERRLQHEGVRNGLYARIEFSGVPCEFVKVSNSRVTAE
jgi:ribosome biogenesis protein BMS1